MIVFGTCGQTTETNPTRHTLLANTTELREQITLGRPEAFPCRTSVGRRRALPAARAVLAAVQALAVLSVLLVVLRLVPGVSEIPF
jgi:hypothetical protein